MSASGLRCEASLATRLRELRETRATGAVRVRYPKGAGAIYVSEGQVVHAEHGRVQGEFGYWQLLGLPEVELSFEEDAAPASRSILRELPTEAWAIGSESVLAPGPAGEPRPSAAPVPPQAPVQPAPVQPAPVQQAAPAAADRALLAETRAAQAPPPPPLRPEPKPEPRPEPRAESRPESGRSRRSSRSFKLLEGTPSGASLRAAASGVDTSAPGAAQPPRAQSPVQPELEPETGGSRRPLLAAAVLTVGLGAAGLLSRPDWLAGAREATQSATQTLQARLSAARAPAPTKPTPRSAPAPLPEVAASEGAAVPLAAAEAPATPVPTATAPTQPVEPAAPEAGEPVEAMDLHGTGDRLPVALGSLQLAAPQPDAGLLPTIVLRLRLDEQGHVAEAAVYQPRAELEAFERLALEKARELSFEPALRDWRAVPVWLDYAVSFSEAAAQGERR